MEAATELGLTKTVEVETDGNTLVVVKRIDLDLETDIKAREMAFADNKIGQDNLDWDPEILKTDLALLDSDFLNGLWEEVDLGGPSYPEDNYSGQNKEIDVGEFDNLMTIKLTFTEDDFTGVRNGLLSIADTMEKAILKLLGL